MCLVAWRWTLSSVRMSLISQGGASRVGSSIAMSIGTLYSNFLAGTSGVENVLRNKCRVLYARETIA